MTKKRPNKTERLLRRKNYKTPTMRIKTIYLIFAAVTAIAAASCSDSKSYAELLTDETHYVNRFLADQRVVDHIPADTVFEVGENAPYYRIDPDGNLYMQVLNAGTPGNRVTDDELIYFRFTRYNLQSYNGQLSDGGGNEGDMSQINTCFRYNNYQLPSSYQWGSGIQYPLSLLPIDCQVNLVVKSQYGFSSETANVIPYLFRLRYYKPQT